MARVAESHAINRKLGAITKGRFSQALDRIEVPTHDWFRSKKNNASYHYDDGNFEAYPSTGTGTFHPHHSLKVIPADTTQIVVRKKEGYWEITHHIEWYHSTHQRSIYLRKGGKTVQYREQKGNRYEEHAESPIPLDVMGVSVVTEGEGYKIAQKHDIPAAFWTDITP